MHVGEGKEGLTNIDVIVWKHSRERGPLVEADAVRICPRPLCDDGACTGKGGCHKSIPPSPPISTTVRRWGKSSRRNELSGEEVRGLAGEEGKGKGGLPG